MEVFVVRHGERLDDVDPSWKETEKERPYDPPLTEAGLQQARKTGLRLRRELTPEQRERAKVISSPFLRCMQTATEIAKALLEEEEGEAEGREDEEEKRSERGLGHGVHVEYGLYEGLLAAWFPVRPSFEGLEERFVVNSSYEAYLSKVTVFPETVEQLARRYTKTAKHLTAKHTPGEPLILVTHGYGVQCISQYFDPELFVIETPYCCISKFRREKPKRSWQTVRFADASHWRSSSSSSSSSC